MRSRPKATGRARRAATASFRSRACPPIWSCGLPDSSRCAPTPAGRARPANGRTEMLLAALSSAPARQTPVVLLVEDHDDTRQMYAEFLGDSYDVRQAGDGHRALEVLQGVRPDLLITDISLPGIDGFELVSMVRSDPISGAI